MLGNGVILVAVLQQKLHGLRSAMQKCPSQVLGLVVGGNFTVCNSLIPYVH